MHTHTHSHSRSNSRSCTCTAGAAPSSPSGPGPHGSAARPPAPGHRSPFRTLRVLASVKGAAHRGKQTEGAEPGETGSGGTCPPAGRCPAGPGPPLRQGAKEGEEKSVLTLHRHTEDLGKPLDSPFGSERGALHHFIGPGGGGGERRGAGEARAGPAEPGAVSRCRVPVPVPAGAARLPFIPLRGARLTSPPAGGRGRDGPPAANQRPLRAAGGGACGGWAWFVRRGRGLRGRGGAGPGRGRQCLWGQRGTSPRPRAGSAPGAPGPCPAPRKELESPRFGDTAPALSLLPLGMEAQPRDASLAPADTGTSRATVSYWPAAVTPPWQALLPQSADTQPWSPSQWCLPRDTSGHGKSQPSSAVLQRAQPGGHKGDTRVARPQSQGKGLGVATTSMRIPMRENPETTQPAAPEGN